MIHLKGIPFGYGLFIGSVFIVEAPYSLNLRSATNSCALAFSLLPSAESFISSTKIAGVSFCIVPLCSSYSHLVATAWSIAVPTMAIEQPQQLHNGEFVLADFDNGELLVAEGEAEAEVLKNNYKDHISHLQNETNEFIPTNNYQTPITVLAEATSASNALGALLDGADGLSVIKGEHLLEINQKILEAEAFINVVKSNPETLPLLIRFFDPEDPKPKVGDIKRIPTPQKFLGYRGVRNPRAR